MGLVKPYVTNAGQSTIENQEMTAQPASTGPNPYSTSDTSLEMKKGVNSRVTKRQQPQK